MIECKIDQKTITFGSSAFCEICGMDLDLNSIKKNHRGAITLYCCENCARL